MQKFHTKQFNLYEIHGSVTKPFAGVVLHVVLILVRAISFGETHEIHIHHFSGMAGMAQWMSCNFGCPRL